MQASRGGQGWDRAPDGTKVAASAALDRNRTWEKLSEQEKVLLAEVESLLGRAEDDRFGDDSGDGLPKVAMAKERLALIQRAKANLTDPESRIMKTCKGFIQGYNAQAVVSQDQIMVACDVGQVAPMMEAAKANLYEIGEESGKVLADAGYQQLRGVRFNGATPLNRWTTFVGQGHKPTIFCQH